MASAYAHAIIGVKVDKDDMFSRRTVKAFNHDFPEDVKFCSNTGKALWKEEDVPVEGYEPGDNKIGPFRLIEDRDRDIFLIGVKEAEHRWEDLGFESLNGFDIEAAKQALKEFLEPRNLWNEETFGLHAYLRWS